MKRITLNDWEQREIADALEQTIALRTELIDSDSATAQALHVQERTNAIRLWERLTGRKHVLTQLAEMESLLRVAGYRPPSRDSD